MSDTIQNDNQNKNLEIDTNGSKGGQPGNQNAKKGKFFTDEIRKLLIQNPEQKQSIAEGLIQAAMAREPWAVKEIMDRMEGKAIQATEISGPDGAEIVKGIGIVFVDGHANNEG